MKVKLPDTEMNDFQKKYGVSEEQTTSDFHRSRRMFCIVDNELKIAPENSPYSHAEWFVNEGWMSKEDDSLMDEIVRGYVSKEGNIYFYTGYDFKVNKSVEEIFFKYLDDLIEKLKLNKENLKIFGGSKLENGLWKPRKEFRDSKVE